MAGVPERGLYHCRSNSPALDTRLRVAIPSLMVRRCVDGSTSKVLHGPSRRSRAPRGARGSGGPFVKSKDGFLPPLADDLPTFVRPVESHRWRCQSPQWRPVQSVHYRLIDAFIKKSPSSTSKPAVTATLAMGSDPRYRVCTISRQPTVLSSLCPPRSPSRRSPARSPTTPSLHPHPSLPNPATRSPHNTPAARPPASARGRAPPAPGRAGSAEPETPP